MRQKLPSIIVKNVSYSFSSDLVQKKALSNIHFSVSPGQFVCIMGPSGAGKTTLLSLIGCLRTLQTGSITVLGNELFRASTLKLQNIRRNIGFIFQDHNLHKSLTAAQNVIMGLGIHNNINEKKFSQAAEHTLNILGLGKFLNSLPNHLSEGEKQRIAIARAIISNPKIILADEPTAALDRKNSSIVVDILKNLGQYRNTITLIVTHDNRIIKLADKVITLEDGNLVT